MNRSRARSLWPSKHCNVLFVDFMFAYYHHEVVLAKRREFGMGTHRHNRIHSALDKNGKWPILYSIQAFTTVHRSRIVSISAIQLMNLIVRATLFQIRSRCCIAVAHIFVFPCLSAQYNSKYCVCFFPMLFLVQCSHSMWHGMQFCLQLKQLMY